MIPDAIITTLDIVHSVLSLKTSTTT